MCCELVEAGCHVSCSFPTYGYARKEVLPYYLCLRCWMWVELSRVYNQMSYPALGTWLDFLSNCIVCVMSMFLSVPKYRSYSTKLWTLFLSLFVHITLCLLRFCRDIFGGPCRDHCWCWLDNERLFRGLAIFRKSRKKTSLRILQCFWVQLPPQWVYLLFLLLMAESV